MVDYIEAFREDLDVAEPKLRRIPMPRRLKLAHLGSGHRNKCWVT
jgi:hypothetical protein